MSLGQWAALFFLWTGASKAQAVPFAFWKAPPAGPCASISGTQTFSSNTTINDAAITTHQCKHWVVNTGVTLTFATNTQAPIGNLTLNGTAKITHSACTTTECYQVNIYVNGDATVASTAKIQADGLGYLGANSGGNNSCKGRTLGNTTTGGASCGTGGADYAAGGSYGGYGGRGYGGELANAPYGSITSPTDPGSGGAGDPAFGGNGGEGGGVIRLIVSGKLTLNGLISANGGDSPSLGAGGSGGSIWITAGTIETGSSGLRISANGGGADGTPLGAGGGGRIAIEYGTLNTFAINSTFINAFGRTTYESVGYSHAGTIYATNGTLAKLYIHNNNITAPTYHETQINEPLSLDSLEILGKAVVKQMSSSNAISVLNAVTVTSPAVMRVPNNGTINSAGPWTWFTYGSLTGTITEY